MQHRWCILFFPQLPLKFPVNYHLGLHELPIKLINPPAHQYANHVILSYIHMQVCYVDVGYVILVRFPFWVVIAEYTLFSMISNDHAPYRDHAGNCHCKSDYVVLLSAWQKMTCEVLEHENVELINWVCYYDIVCCNYEVRN